MSYSDAISFGTDQYTANFNYNSPPGFAAGTGCASALGAARNGDRRACTRGVVDSGLVQAVRDAITHGYDHPKTEADARTALQSYYNEATLDLARRKAECNYNPMTNDVEVPRLPPRLVVPGARRRSPAEIALGPVLAPGAQESFAGSASGGVRSGFWGSLGGMFSDAGINIHLSRDTILYILLVFIFITMFFQFRTLNALCHRVEGAKSA